jgi:hypothetical protein
MAAPDYSPSVGDVVEFEYKGETCKGIIFLEDGRLLASTRLNPDGVTTGFATLIGNAWEDVYHGMKKTGVSSISLDGLDYNTAQVKAKAYFAAKPASAPVGFKVGDRVKVVRKTKSGDIKHHLWMDGMDKSVGTVFTVSQIGQDAVKSKENGYFFPLASLAPAPLTYTADPDKSYSDNQAAWIEFHGLKAGSKVRAVLAWKNGDNGCNTCTGSDEYGCKASAIRDRAVGKIGSIDSGAFNVIMPREYDGNLQYPYFALEPVA